MIVNHNCKTFRVQATDLPGRCGDVAAVDVAVDAVRDVDGLARSVRLLAKTGLAFHWIINHPEPGAMARKQA